MKDQIRQILSDHARLSADASALSDDADLYEAGMTSHASVNVMLALEDAFDVEFPDEMLKRSVFESVASISAALPELNPQAAGASPPIATPRSWPASRRSPTRSPPSTPTTWTATPAS